MLYVIGAVVVVLQLIQLWRQHRMSETLTAHEQAQAEAMANLTKEVAEAKGAMASATTLIISLAQRLREAAFDPAQVNALASQLDAFANPLAEAVAANPFSEAATGIPRSGEETITAPVLNDPVDLPPADPLPEPVLEPAAEANAEVAAEIESLEDSSAKSKKK